MRPFGAACCNNCPCCCCWRGPVRPGPGPVREGEEGGASRGKNIYIRQGGGRDSREISLRGSMISGQISPLMTQESSSRDRNHSLGKRERGGGRNLFSQWTKVLCFSGFFYLRQIFIFWGGGGGSRTCRVTFYLYTCLGFHLFIFFGIWHSSCPTFAMMQTVANPSLAT